MIILERLFQSRDIKEYLRRKNKRLLSSGNKYTQEFPENGCVMSKEK